MRKVKKIFFAVVLCCAILSNGFYVTKAEASSRISMPSDIGSRMQSPINQLDPTKTYKRYEASRWANYIRVDQTNAAKGLEKRDALGYTIVRTAVYVPTEKSEDESYHCFLAYECEMHAGTMNTSEKIRSYALTADVGFAIPNLSTAIISPEKEELPVQTSSTTTETVSHSFGLSGGFSNSKKDGKGFNVEGSFSAEKTHTMEMTISYQANALSYTPMDAAGMAEWQYTYNIYEDDNTDKWASGKTTTGGMVEFTQKSNASWTGRKINAEIVVSFGAQYFEANRGKKKGYAIKKGSNPTLGTSTGQVNKNSKFTFSY